MTTNQRRNRPRMPKRHLLWIAALGATLGSGSSLAYDFVPTDAEWMAWPEFCKAIYVGGPGVPLSLVNQVDQGMKERSAALIGTCFSSVHHYCAGLYRLDRALRFTGNARAFGLHQAEAEHYYTRQHCPRDNGFWSTNEAQLALVKAEAGKSGEAIATLDEAQKAHPDNPGPYLVRARLLIRAGKRQEALKVLAEGSQATEGKSAELEYALGLSYFHAKDYEAAQDRARVAYSLGYPLPWLRDNLLRVGYPL